MDQAPYRLEKSFMGEVETVLDAQRQFIVLEAAKKPFAGL